MQMHLQKKSKELEDILGKYSDLIVAFSGGVDSTLLLYMAFRVLGDRVLAITARSPVHPEREIRFAEEFTAQMGIPHMVVDSREMQQDDFRANRPDRCYVCKKNLLTDLIELGHNRGMKHLVHGANLDDLGDFRPGMQAAREASILAPYIELSINKGTIRAISAYYNLEIAEKPAMPCMASRIAYGEEVTREKLDQIEAAESFLNTLGFKEFRVRHHGDTARIEVLPRDLAALIENREKISSKLHELGFVYVSLDLDGFKSGSLNAALNTK